MENKLIYLYIKESPQGLKYLGQTTKDPFKYKGSGQWWKRHIKLYNLSSEDIKTTILHETYKREEIKEKGLYYSTLWDVVKSKEWANLIPETGEHSTLGYKPSLETLEKIRKANTGKKKSEESKRKTGVGIRKHLEIYGKSDKQKESARNVWLGKQRPKEMTEKLIEANSIKLVNKFTNEIFKSIKDLATYLNSYTSTILHNLKYNENFEYRYLDESLYQECLKIQQNKENALNYRVSKIIEKKTSKYLGVSWNKEKKKWNAQARSFENSKKVFLGYFLIEEDARDAYLNYLSINQKQKEYVPKHIKRYKGKDSKKEIKRDKKE